MICNLLTLLYLATLVASAPTNPDQRPYQTEQANSGQTSQNGLPQTSMVPELSTNFHADDYVYYDHEFDSVLERLRSETSSVNEPGNYVHEDMPLEDILKLIELSETEGGLRDGQVSTRSPTSTGSGPQVESTTSSTTNEQCPICYERLSELPHVVTNCNHNFHQKCLVEWRDRGNPRHPKCPVCRRILYSTDFVARST